VVVSIKEVRAVPAGQEGAAEQGLPLIAAFETPKTVNVLDLVFQQELLGEAVLPAGSYHQLRLVLEQDADPAAPANYIAFVDAPEVKVPLKTPSGQESGLKVVGRFDVEAGAITAVSLDFDPARAIVQAAQSGQWLFKPTGIRVVQTENLLLTYGGIIGRVALEVIADGATSQLPVTEAMVLALLPESETVVAAGAVNSEDGTFRLFLPGGSYRLKATAPGFEDLISDPLVVVEGADTDAGTLLLNPAN
jgi:hypothetical protein